MVCVCVCVCVCVYCLLWFSSSLFVTGGGGGGRKKSDEKKNKGLILQHSLQTNFEILVQIVQHDIKSKHTIKNINNKKLH